jgi:hypothetical protein
MISIAESRRVSITVPNTAIVQCENITPTGNSRYILLRFNKHPSYTGLPPLDTLGNRDRN